MHHSLPCKPEGFWPTAKHVGNGATHCAHFFVDLAFALRSPSGRLPSQELRLQLLRSFGMLIRFLVAANVPYGHAIHVGGDRKMGLYWAAKY